METTRVFLEAIGGLLLVVAAWVIFTPRAPERFSLPPAAFSSDNNSIHARGTWERRGEPLAWPTQFTIIDCYRPELQCVDATSIVVQREQLLMSMFFYKIACWNADFVIAAGKVGIAADIQIVFDVKNRTVRATNHPAERASCTNPEDVKVELQLIDAYKRDRLPLGTSR